MCKSIINKIIHLLDYAHAQTKSIDASANFIFDFTYKCKNYKMKIIQKKLICIILIYFIDSFNVYSVYGVCGSKFTSFVYVVFVRPHVWIFRQNTRWTDNIIFCEEKLCTPNLLKHFPQTKISFSVKWKSQTRIVVSRRD